MHCSLSQSPLVLLRLSQQIKASKIFKNYSKINYQTLQNMKVFLAQEMRRRMQYENKTRAENNAIFVARDCLVDPS